MVIANLKSSGRGDEVVLAAMFDVVRARKNTPQMASNLKQLMRRIVQFSFGFF